MMFSGPSFESPAEIVFARTVGAAAVGMSTVPEAIVAAHCGMHSIGISLITNMAAGILDQKLTHEEVQETAAIASEKRRTWPRPDALARYSAISARCSRAGPSTPSAGPMAMPMLAPAVMEAPSIA